MEKIIHVGDSMLMVPAAAIILLWLIISSAWRMAIWWSILFIIGIGCVAITKIIFIAWGVGMPWLHFNAISGHASCTAAIFPVIAHLLLQRANQQLRITGIVAGLILSIFISILLVWFDQHTTSETAIGWLLGAMISLSFIRISRGSPPPRLRVKYFSIGLLALPAVFYLSTAPTAYWMIKIALFISGHHQPCTWKSFIAT